MQDDEAVRTIPAENDGAEAESVGFDGAKEFGLRHYLPSQDTVDVDT